MYDHGLVGLYPGRKGRKQRSDVEIPQTIWWVSEVLDKSGESLTSLNRRFKASDGAVDWFRFYGGYRTPSPELIAKVEKDINGTQRIFTHPLWLLLKEPDASEKLLNTIYPALPEGVKQFLKDTGRKWPLTLFSFERYQVKELFKLSPPDALSAVLIMACYARVIRGRRLEERAREFFFRLVPSIYWLPTIRDIFVRLKIVRTTRVVLNPYLFLNPATIPGDTKVPVTDILLAMINEKLDMRLELKATLAIPITFDWRHALGAYDKEGNRRKNVSDEQIAREIEESYRVKN